MTATDKDLLDMARKIIKDLEEKLRSANQDRDVEDVKRIEVLERRNKLLFDTLDRAERNIARQRTWAGVNGWKYNGVSAFQQEQILARIQKTFDTLREENR